MLGKILIALVLINAIFAEDFLLPPLKKCHENDENCWIEQAQTFIDIYSKGDPERNIQSVDPFKVEDFIIKGMGSTPATLTMSDMKIYNLSEAKVTNIRGLSKDTTKPLKLQLIFKVPEMTYVSKYTVEGKILIFPIKGFGDAVISAQGITVKLSINLKSEKHVDGKTYLEAIDTKIASEAKNATIFLSNLFHGDKELSENLLRVINDNWKLLESEFDPVVNRQLEKLFTKTFNMLFKDVPYDDFFLEN